MPSNDISCSSPSQTIECKHPHCEHRELLVHKDNIQYMSVVFNTLDRYSVHCIVLGMMNFNTNVVLLIKYFGTMQYNITTYNTI